MVKDENTVRVGSFLFDTLTKKVYVKIGLVNYTVCDPVVIESVTTAALEKIAELAKRDKITDSKDITSEDEDAGDEQDES